MPNLTKTRTGNYTPSASTGFFQFTSRREEFQRFYIPLMIRHPHVQLGLKIIKGRILARAKFYVEESDDRIKHFLVQQITNFWMFSAMRALTALEWGYCGLENLFEVKNGLYHYRQSKNFHAYDTHLVTNPDGEKVGIRVNNTQDSHKRRVYIGGPKSLWHVQRREHHPWYGYSILAGAFDPWLETWKDGGQRDIRNLYFYKYAFTGESLYYPTGVDIVDDTDNNYITNRDVAREIVEKRGTGAVAVFPNEKDDNGQRLWEWVPASPGPGAAPILEYGDNLKTEILEGMGVPREVVEAANVGSGYSGRLVPLEAFDSILQDIVNWLIFDFCDQVLKPLVQINFSINPSFQVYPFGLARGTHSEQHVQEGQPEPDMPMSLPFAPSPSLKSDPFGITYYHAS